MNGRQAVEYEVCTGGGSSACPNQQDEQPSTSPEALVALGARLPRLLHSPCSAVAPCSALLAPTQSGFHQYPPACHHRRTYSTCATVLHTAELLKVYIFTAEDVWS